jgi:hypothetical protein
LGRAGSSAKSGPSRDFKRGDPAEAEGDESEPPPFCCVSRTEGKPKCEVDELVESPSDPPSRWSDRAACSVAPSPLVDASGWSPSFAGDEPGPFPASDARTTSVSGAFCNSPRAASAKPER